MTRFMKWMTVTVVVTGLLVISNGLTALVFLSWGHSRGYHEAIKVASDWIEQNCGNSTSSTGTNSNMISR